ncbi:MAG: hypothetical protein ACM3L5_00525 [Candidatus Saccharibacteria bacterium]
MQEHQEDNQMLEQLAGGAFGKTDIFTGDPASLTSMIYARLQKEESRMIREHDSFDRSNVQKLSQKFDEIDNRISQKAKCRKFTSSHFSEKLGAEVILSC